MRDRLYCNRCKNVVIRERIKEIDYPYYCSSCDENMYSIETHKETGKKSVFDQIQNTTDVINRLMKLAAEEIDNGILSDEECLNEDAKCSIDFLSRLPDIIRSACLLAVYAGEDWAHRQTAFNFGADSYEYIDDYINSGQDLSHRYGETDFFDEFMAYYRDYIQPK